MFHFAMSTVSMSVCITLTIAVLTHSALNSGAPMPRPCLIYSGAVAAASSAAVMGLALIARLSIAQTIMLTMAFAVVLAIVWEYAGLDARTAFAYWSVRSTAATGPCDRVGMVNTATWATATDGDSDSDTPRPRADTPLAGGEPDAKAPFDCARLPGVGPEECELLARAGREGAGLGEVDRALAVLMKLLIHPALVRDAALRRDLVDHQRRLHARHAVLSMQASGQGGDIGQSAARAQVEARLARLYSSLREEYSDD
ncbi:MAG: hypothetical protein KA002_00620 [Firmicutes bacterium]|nr:hypothetical protein [Bacillota bacterium]